MSLDVGDEGGRIKDAAWLFGLKPLVPNLFRTRDWYHGRQFSHRLGVGRRGGFRIIQAQECSSSYEALMPPLMWQKALLRRQCKHWGAAVKTRSLAVSPPPAVLPRSNRSWTGTSPWPGSWGPLGLRIWVPSLSSKSLRAQETRLPSRSLNSHRGAWLQVGCFKSVALGSLK